MYTTHCEAERPSTPARPGVMARRAVQQARSTVRSKIVRMRRAQFALTHLERHDIPEARLARSMDLISRVGSSVRPEHLTVSIGQLLIGGEPGISARRIAAELSEPLRPSTRLVDGALAQLIRRYQAEGGSSPHDERLA